MRKPRDLQRGTVAVEFGLILTVLVLFIGAALEGGLNVARRHAIVTAARAGAMAGAKGYISNHLDTAATSAAISAANARLTELGFKTADSSVTATVTDPSPQGTAPNQINVTVNHKYKPIVPLMKTTVRAMTTTVSLPLLSN